MDDIDTLKPSPSPFIRPYLQSDPRWEVIQGRNDYKMIINTIDEGASVLDLGCGSGWLLALLRATKNIHGYGVELDTERIIECVEKGISVFQGNIDEGLRDFEDGSFDYVILNQTLPVIHRPLYMLKEMLRVGKRAIISFVNFGFWRVRLRLLLNGRMPMTKALPYEWYDTPMIHPLTIRDFVYLCRQHEFSILEQAWFNDLESGSTHQHLPLPNLQAAYGVFVITSPL